MMSVFIFYTLLSDNDTEQSLWDVFYRSFTAVTNHTAFLRVRPIKHTDTQDNEQRTTKHNGKQNE